MTAPLRPCSKCGRHVRTDATRCPFCGAELGVMHALPVLVSPFADERPAPKYGGAPYRRPVAWVGCALVAVVVGALAFALSRLVVP